MDQVMMCEKPFIRNPTGKLVRRAGLLPSDYSGYTAFGCGRCLFCLINKSRVWQHRILLEAKSHLHNCFVTLTYANEYLPHNGSVVPEDMSLWLKKFRHAVEPKKIRYFGIGEYGDKSERPHYHLAIFGHSHYRKEVIEKTWNMGRTSVDPINENTAGYIAGYCTSKLNRNDKYAGRFLKGRHPEFMRVSKMKGGLGLEEIKKIGKKIREAPFFERRVISELTHGKKRFPLGRYLTEKLNKEIGLTEKEIYENLYVYQKQFIDRNLDGDGIYYDNILNEEDGKKRKIKGRRKFFRTSREMENIKNEKKFI